MDTTSYTNLPGSLPPSIVIMHALADGLTWCSDLLQERSDEFNACYALLHEGKGTASEKCVAFYQLLHLALLSMHQGILVPEVKNCTWDGKRFSLMWNGGIKESLVLGDHDHTSEVFVKTICNRIFGYGKIPKGFSLLFLAGTLEILKVYEKNLLACQAQINRLVSDKADLKRVLKNDIDADLMFILFSCLPIEELNKLFTYLYQFFPEDLMVKTQDGNVVKVATLFQSSSLDVQYLVKKVMIYNDLYFSSDLPIIKEITHLKTKAFLVSLLKQKSSFDQTAVNLKSIQTQQIHFRLSLYKVLISRLSLLLVERP
jgi:hypothetical protein